MDIEFHYYINYLIAINAGFKPEIAAKVAYSAQYVDDNTASYNIISDVDNSVYSSVLSQSFNPSIDIKTSIEIYPVFHFIPGDDIMKSSILRRDGECRHMSTLPKSKLAQKMLRQALDSDDPYWIGIASHAYVDTWAHQNFTGMKDLYNCVHGYYVNNKNSQDDIKKKNMGQIIS